MKIRVKDGWAGIGTEVYFKNSTKDGWDYGKISSIQVFKKEKYIYIEEKYCRDSLSVYLNLENLLIVETADKKRVKTGDYVWIWRGENTPYPFPEKKRVTKLGLKDRKKNWAKVIWAGLPDNLAWHRRDYACKCYSSEKAAIKARPELALKLYSSAYRAGKSVTETF